MTASTDRPLTRKRIAKLAARLPENEIRASLAEGDDFRFYIDETTGLIGLWTAGSGPGLVMQDDPVKAQAQLAFMRRNGYPSFRSDDEVRAYATAHGWPTRRRD